MMRWLILLMIAAMSLAHAQSPGTLPPTGPLTTRENINNQFRSKTDALNGTLNNPTVTGGSLTNTTVDGTAYGVPNALCDGVTDDTAAFTAALAADTAITLPPGKVCLVNALSLTGGKTLDCSGSYLQAASATSWILKKTGFRSMIRNCGFIDANGYTAQSTTLTALAAPGATTLTVASVAGMGIGEPVVILLASGAYHISKITNIVGLVLTIQDPIPSTVTGAAVSAAGASYGNDVATVQGGIGPPAIVALTQSGGAITAASVLVPGLYTTTPANPAALLDGQSLPANGGTLTLTYSGANNGASVEASWGALVVDQAGQGRMDNLIWSAVPAALGIYGSGVSAPSYTNQETLSGFTMNASRLFGIFRDVNVSNMTIANGFAFGNTHGASSYGTAGLYLDAKAVTAAPSGGNHLININVLNFETGVFDRNGQLDTFTDLVSDTSRNYALVCDGCTSTIWNGAPWLSFTGPSAISGTGGQGLGAYFGNSAINNLLTGLVTMPTNGMDLHIADTLSGPWLGTWGPSKRVSGLASALAAQTTLFSTVSVASAGGSGITIYLGAIYSTSEFATQMLNSLKGVITKFSCTSGSAPGVGNSYTCNLRTNGVTRQSCSYTGAGVFSCTGAGPGVPIFDFDAIDVQIVSSASAPAQTFRAYVAAR